MKLSEKITIHLKQFILEEQRCMYYDLQIKFWSSCMKSDIVNFVAQCLTCQQGKIDN